MPTSVSSSNTIAVVGGDAARPLPNARAVIAVSGRQNVFAKLLLAGFFATLLVLIGLFVWDVDPIWIANYDTDIALIACSLAFGWAWMFATGRVHRMGRALSVTALLLSLGLLGLGYSFTHTEMRERTGAVESMVRAYAPTYSLELQELGHAEIKLDTPPNDPHYLRLISIQKRWLRANKEIADIYTFRKLPDGKVVLVVDSETDYNRNGTYDGEREQRTQIGEVYDEASPTLLKAFEGQGGFDPEIVSDRWGQWVSAYSPIFDSTGHVEAVLGVDFPAGRWKRAIMSARLEALRYALTLLGLVVGGTLAMTTVRTIAADRGVALEALRAKQSEVEAAVHASEAANRAKSEFLANMSHEIRTPLNGVVGALDLLSRSTLDARQRRFLQIARTSSETLLALINDVLDLSKVEAARMELENSEFDLHGVVEQVSEVIGQRAHEKGLELSMLVHPDVPRSVWGDQLRVRQVLLNLVSNALKFTAQGGVTVRVSLDSVFAPALNALDRSDTTNADRRMGVSIRFSVTDTGIGIAPEQMTRLFQPFSQADASTTRRYGGTGLGLTISKRLVQLMGGEIGVSSEPGRGSTFWFALPFRVGMSAGVRASADADIRTIRYLVIDDAQDERSEVMGILNELGFTCDEAADSVSGLGLLRAAASTRQPFGVVLLKAKMSGSSIAEFSQALITDPSLGMPVLVLFHDEFADTATGSLPLGVHAVIGSELTPTILVEAITTALASASIAHLCDEYEEKKVETVIPEDLRRRRGQFCILLAEDNEFNRLIAGELLSEAGYRFEIASNGSEAVDAVMTEKFDLVLMDCHMPQLDGYAAAEVVRLAEREQRLPLKHGRRLPIVALTASALDSDRDQCYAVGMDGCLTKPIDSESLMATLDRTLLPFADQAKPQPVAAATPPPPTDHPVNFESLSHLCRGKPELLERMIRVFKQSSTPLVEEARAAADVGDMVRVRERAHALRGGAGNFYAKPLAAAAGALEQAAINADAEGVRMLVAQVEREYARCLAVLDIQEAASSNSASSVGNAAS